MSTEIFTKQSINFGEYLMIVLRSFFLFLHGNMLWVLCRSTLMRHTSNEYTQHMVLWTNRENYPRILIKFSSLTTPLICDDFATPTHWFTFCRYWTCLRPLDGWQPSCQRICTLIQGAGLVSKLNFCMLNPCHAEPGYTLPLQTV